MIQEDSAVAMEEREESVVAMIGGFAILDLPPCVQERVMNVTKSLEEIDEGLRVKSTKSGKPRRSAVPREALEALQEHRREQDRERALFGPDYQENNLMFAHPDGSYYKPDKVNVRITKMAKKAGLAGVGLHTLRHSHASELLSKGAPIPTVAKRLGHANANLSRCPFIAMLSRQTSSPRRRSGMTQWPM